MLIHNSIIRIDQRKLNIAWVGFFYLLLIGSTGCSSSTVTPILTPTNTLIATEQSPTETSTFVPPTLTGTPTQEDISSNSKHTPKVNNSTATVEPINTKTPTKTTQSSPTETDQATLRPDEWKELPITPEISQTTLEIYRRGLEMGNNPTAFSKIGDCGSTPAWFLGDFDRGPEFYELGEYEYLEEVIQVFQGSYGRTSLAARSGFNASSLFVPIWADRSQCESDETPLACEYRQHKPIIAFIMLGSNDVWHPEEFEPQMRKLIEYLIERGVIPILSTKADNEEGDGSINDTIARLAQEYDVPLWNYWLALEPLPDRGLQDDNVHLTFGRNFFDDPEAMKKGWPIRNLTALQTLDAIWQEVAELKQ
jgi:hypothetical protein